MMSLYFVKRPLYGIEAGRVERFAHHAAGPLLSDGSIEAFNEKNGRHAQALREQDAAAREQQQRAQKKLDAERMKH
jgi:hypothetical protein